MHFLQILHSIKSKNTVFLLEITEPLQHILGYANTIDTFVCKQASVHITMIYVCTLAYNGFSRPRWQPYPNQ